MEALPLEIKKEIINYLADKEQRQIRVANSKWFKIVNYSNFTLFLTRKEEWKQIVDRFEQYQHPISLRLAKNVMKNVNDIFEHLTRLNNLVSCSTQFHVTGDFSDFDKLTLMTNLKEIPFGLYVPPNILQQLTHLEVLKSYESSDPGNFSNLLPLNTNLREVDISGDIWNNITHAHAGLTSYHTKLTRLEIDVRKVVPGSEDPLRLDGLKFLLYHVVGDESDQEVSLKYLTALEDLRVKSNGKLLGLESCSRLTSLFIYDSHLIGQEKSSLMALNGLLDLELLIDGDNLDYLTTFTNLRALKIWYVPEGKNRRSRYISILGNIWSSKLTSLQIDIGARKMDAENLSQLTSLQDLQLLDVAYCGHENLLLLTNLTNFKWLGQLEYVEDGLVNFLPRMTTLRELSYEPSCFLDEHVFDDIDLSALTNLESLELLLLATYRGLENLTNLTAFSLKGYDADTEHELLYLEKMTNLEILECEVNCSRALQYFSAMTNLRELALNQLRTEDDLLHVTMLTRLTSLTVENENTADGAKVLGHHLTTLTSLQKLLLHAAEEKIAHHFPFLNCTFN